MQPAASESSSDGCGDPEPACPPPAWAADLVADARLRAGSNIYPPSDDTFLLLEVLAEDAVRLRKLQPRICLEIGSGTGTLLAGLLEVLRGTATTPAGQATAPAARAPLLFAVDKNPDAVACTDALLRARGAPVVSAIQASLTASLRLQGAVDVGLCNPPYVPTTDPEEMHSCGIAASWAGGERGREVIDLLLPCIAGLLAPGGLFYLVCVAENHPDEIMSVVASSGLRAEIARREVRGIEELLILRFEREWTGDPDSGA
mmetsp:Transcript_82386/g.241831  ORF Transcript_82386/g.241831 Transcript_82386/m.241831 type:complete len:260 (-) Transcript_82386:232-1011(-)